MTPAWAILAALVAGYSGCGIAQEYDDPAVAACQYQHLGAGPLPAGWARTRTTISGTDVELAYSVSVLNTRPTEKVMHCTFEKNAQGKFTFAITKDPKVTECQAFMDKVDADAAASLPPAEKQPIMDRMQECISIFEASLKSTTNMLTDVIMRLTMAGLLPIDPSNTDLR